MTEHGERRRMDRLLSDDLLDRLPDLDDATLLADRDAALREESDLSYVRRLLQGRLDLLRFEQERRASGAADQAPPGTQQADEELVKALSRVLASGTRAPAATSAPSAAPAGDHGVDAEPTTVSRRREAEAAAGDIRVSDPRSLDDEGLASALHRFSELEAQVSGSRAQMQQIANALTDEVARRIEAGRMSAESLQTSG